MEDYEGNRTTINTTISPTNPPDPEVQVTTPNPDPDPTASRPGSAEVTTQQVSHYYSTTERSMYHTLPPTIRSALNSSTWQIPNTTTPDSATVVTLTSSEGEGNFHLQNSAIRFFTGTKLGRSLLTIGSAYVLNKALGVLAKLILSLPLPDALKNGIIFLSNLPTHILQQFLATIKHVIGKLKATNPVPPQNFEVPVPQPINPEPPVMPASFAYDLSHQPQAQSTPYMKRCYPSLDSGLNSMSPSPVLNQVPERSIILFPI